MIFPLKLILTSYKYVCFNPEILLRQQILLILFINPLTGSAAPSLTAPPGTSAWSSWCWGCTWRWPTAACRRCWRPTPLYAVRFRVSFILLWNFRLINRLHLLLYGQIGANSVYHWQGVTRPDSARLGHLKAWLGSTRLDFEMAASPMPAAWPLKIPSF